MVVRGMKSRGIISLVLARQHLAELNSHNSHLCLIRGAFFQKVIALHVLRGAEFRRQGAAALATRGGRLSRGVVDPEGGP